MQSAAWWTAKPREDLSQGDILEHIPIVLAPMPLQYVKPQQFKGGITGWVKSDVPFKDKGGRVTLFSAGFVSLAIIISHDCDLDDQGSSKSVLVARVELIDAAPPEHRPVIISQENLPRMFLPEVPAIGNCFANLRSIATVERAAVNGAKRIASMSDDARIQMQARLVAVFTRRCMPPPKG